MEMPRKEMLRGEASTASVYSESTRLGVKGDPGASMAVIIVVDSAYIGGHSYIAFEWFERVRDAVVRRHQIFHLEGKERRDPLTERLWRAIGYGSRPGRMAPVAPQDPAPVEGLGAVTVVDSDPEYFKTRATRSHYRVWIVSYANGEAGHEYARRQVGPVNFSLIPMWRSTYNCAQMAGEIARRAGVPNPFGWFGTILPSWNLWVQMGTRAIGGRPRPPAAPSAHED
jgi:hypothetical protein